MALSLSHNPVRARARSRLPAASSHYTVHFFLPYRVKVPAVASVKPSCLLPPASSSFLACVIRAKC